jgi:hypothetical protein
MNIDIATKKQLIAEMGANSFKPAMTTAFSHYESYEYRGQTSLRPIYKEAEAGHLVAHSHGFTARIHENGRVTLDVGFDYCGALFNGTAKGKTPAEKNEQAVKLLHEAISNSGLKD